MPQYIVADPSGAQHVIEAPDEPMPDAAVVPTGDPSALHTAEVGAASIPKGALNTWNMFGRGAAETGEMPGLGAASQNFGFIGEAPKTPVTPPDTEGGLNSLYQDFSKNIAGLGPTPQSPREQYIDAAGQAIGGGAATGGLSLAALATAGASGLGSEFAAHNLSDDPITRVAAGLATGLGVNLPRLLVGNASKLAKAGLAGTTDAYLKAASSNQSIADVLLGSRKGGQSNLTVAQAMQSPANRNLLGVQNYLANSVVPDVGGETQATLSGQPMAASVGKDNMIGNLPGSASPPVAANNAAQQAVSDTYDAIRGKASMAFRAALNPKEKIPASVAPALGHQLTTIALGEGSNGARALAEDVRDALYDPVTGNPVTDPVVLNNRVNEALRGQGANMVKTPGARASLNSVAQQFKEAYTNSLNKVGGTIPAARQAYETIMETEGDPLRKSATGTLLGTGASPTANAPAGKAFGILSSANSSPDDIRQLAASIRQSNPTGFSDLVSSWLKSRADEASPTGTLTNPDASIHDALHSAFWSTEGQQARIQAIAEEVAKDQGQPPATISKGLTNFFNTNALMRQRPSVVGGTPAGEVENASRGNLISGVLSAIGIAPIKGPANYVAKLYSQNALRTVDKALNSPDGAYLLRALANKPSGGPTAAALTGALISSGSREPDYAPNQNQ